MNRWIENELSDSFYYKRHFDSPEKAEETYSKISLNKLLTINGKCIIPFSRSLNITYKSKYTSKRFLVDVEGIQLIIES